MDTGFILGDIWKLYSMLVMQINEYENWQIFRSFSKYHRLFRWRLSKLKIWEKKIKKLINIINYGVAELIILILKIFSFIRRN